MIEFVDPNGNKAQIRIVGVGGAGGNAVNTMIAAGLSCVGLLHAYRLTRDGVENHFGIFAAPAFAVVYAVAAGVLYSISPEGNTWMRAKLGKTRVPEEPPISRDKVTIRAENDDDADEIAS